MKRLIGSLSISAAGGYFIGFSAQGQNYIIVLAACAVWGIAVGILAMKFFHEDGRFKY